MDAETLTLAAGALLSLGFAYIPGLAGWYNRLGEKPEDGSQAGGDGGTRKRLVMLGLLVLVSLGAFGLGCMGGNETPAGQVYLGLRLTCDDAGAWALAKAFILSVMANQATYQITSKSRGSERR
jgi:hypothetical protein